MFLGTLFEAEYRLKQAGMHRRELPAHGVFKPFGYRPRFPDAGKTCKAMKGPVQAAPFI
jgi:hypothetical protein